MISQTEDSVNSKATISSKSETFTNEKTIQGKRSRSKIGDELNAFLTLDSWLGTLPVEHTIIPSNFAFWVNRIVENLAADLYECEIYVETDATFKFKPRAIQVI